MMLENYTNKGESFNYFTTQIQGLSGVTPFPSDIKYLIMVPPKDHAVGDILIVAKLEFIWFICCILMENSYNNKRTHVLTLVAMVTTT